MLLPFNMTLTTFEYGEKVVDGFESHQIWSSQNNQQEEHHHLPLYSSWHWTLPLTMENILGHYQFQAQLETLCQQRE